MSRLPCSASQANTTCGQHMIASSTAGGTSLTGLHEAGSGHHAYNQQPDPGCQPPAASVIAHCGGVIGPVWYGGGRVPGQGLAARDT